MSGTYPPVYDEMYDVLMKDANSIRAAKYAVKNAPSIPEIIKEAEKLKKAYADTLTRFNGTFLPKVTEKNGYTIRMLGIDDEIPTELNLVNGDKYNKMFVCSVTKADTTGYLYVPYTNMLYYHDDLTRSDEDASRPLSSIKENDDKDDIYDILKMARQMFINAN